MAEPAKQDPEKGSNAKNAAPQSPSTQNPGQQNKQEPAKPKTETRVRYLYRGPSLHGLRFGQIYIGLPKIFSNAIKRVDSGTREAVQKKLFVDISMLKPREITSITTSPPVHEKNFDAIMRGEKLPKNSPEEKDEANDKK